MILWVEIPPAAWPCFQASFQIPAIQAALILKWFTYKFSREDSPTFYFGFWRYCGLICFTNNTFPTCRAVTCLFLDGVLAVALLCGPSEATREHKSRTHYPCANIVVSLRKWCAAGEKQPTLPSMRFKFACNHAKRVLTVRGFCLPHPACSPVPFWVMTWWRSNSSGGARPSRQPVPTRVIPFFPTTPQTLNRIGEKENNISVEMGEKSPRRPGKAMEGGEAGWAEARGRLGLGGVAGGRRKKPMVAGEEGRLGCKGFFWSGLRINFHTQRWWCGHVRIKCRD